MTALDLLAQLANDQVLWGNMYYTEYLPLLFSHCKLENQKVKDPHQVYTNLCVETCLKLWTWGLSASSYFGNEQDDKVNYMEIINLGLFSSDLNSLFLQAN